MNTLTILSAGSFRRALNALADAFHEQNRTLTIDCHFGPAGLLRERIEQGEHCDIFISANLEHIDTLSAQHKVLERATIAHNCLGLTAKRSPQTEGRDALSLLFDRTLRLGTSTPNADPCGDYAWQLFERIDARYPGEGKSLKQRALPLVGGKTTAAIPEGEIASRYLLAHNKADLFLGYAHYAPLLAADLALITPALPSDLNIIADYGCAQLQANAVASAFFTFLQSAQGQRIIAAHGFIGG